MNVNAMRGKNYSQQESLERLAIFGFAIQEAISSSAVVDETPFFFFPIMETLKMYTNSGYIS